MKCIKKHGVIQRVKNEVAEDMVNNKEWAYCPKSEWKAIRDAEIKNRD